MQKSNRIYKISKNDNDNTFLEPELILLAVGWYLSFSLSYRDVEELLAERGLLVDQTSPFHLLRSVDRCP
jgi:transposase-like protein